MEKTTVPKAKVGRIIFKNLIILLVVLVAAFSGTHSWFTSNRVVNANGMSVRAKGPEKIEIAVVPKGSPVPADDSLLWHEGTIELNSDNYPALFTNLYLSDIDGDGTSFYKPLMKQTGLIAQPDTAKAADWDRAVANVDYLSVDIYGRTQKESEFTGIKISKDSAITPTKAISNGTFTPDGVVGAVRFSYISKQTNSQQTKIWIPAPNVFYNDATKTLNKDYLNNSFTLPYGSTGYGYRHYYYSKTASTATFSTYSTANTMYSTNGDYKLGSDDNFLIFETTTSNNSKYKYGMTTCNMWIEGEDTEARLATVGGNFSIKLKFVGYN